jgi:zinc transporter 1/2/3
LVAIGLHQFFEGVSLGSALLEGKISMRYVYSFGTLFALTAPIGVVLGMYASTDDETGELVTGFADAFAAGVLMYSSIVDMVAEDYMDSNFKSRHFGKMSMYFFLSFGISVMAILAIWA